ncbi:hypothetical protein F5Y13DRAFT_176396 [Hypoxylon sp. FL1857]|nr:hypothetical protein F5Y13DRAFT_176396 [Hypoxylon sp. FL1857]
MGGNLIYGKMSLRPKKRQLEEDPTVDPSPAKVARFMDTDRTTLRRSPRLQRKHHPAAGEGPSIVRSTPPHEPQAERGDENAMSPSKRPGSQHTNVQEPRVELEVEEATKHESPNPSSTPILIPGTNTKRQIQVVLATRSQKLHDDDDDDSKHQVKLAQLTQENLALFNEATKRQKTLKKANKVTNKAPTPALPEPTDTLLSLKTHFKKNGLLDPLSSKPPRNLKGIRARYVSSSVSTPPSELAYVEYRQYGVVVEMAGNKDTMIFQVGSRLLKANANYDYKPSFKRAFTNFPTNVGFNNGLSTPQPDFVEGPLMVADAPFSVDECPNGAVLYKNDPHSLILPHIAGEWKECGMDIEEAKLRARYHGAALVYARNQALSLMGRLNPPGHAEVTTGSSILTVQLSILTVYPHH